MKNNRNRTRWNCYTIQEQWYFNMISWALVSYPFPLFKKPVSIKSLHRPLRCSTAVLKFNLNERFLECVLCIRLTSILDYIQISIFHYRTLKKETFIFNLSCPNFQDKDRSNDDKNIPETIRVQANDAGRVKF